MAYTINLTDGAIFATIPDGTINQSSSMTLIGKNYAGYGAFLDTNFIHLLENGSNTTPPTNPLTGQLWWDLSNGVLKVYNGTTFKTVSAATASATAPTSNIVGDLWFNTTANVLNVYNGSSFIAVGPSITNGTGTQPNVIIDNTSVSHNVIEMVVGNNVVGIVSKDAAFTPAAPIAGFTTVRPGITLATTVGGVAQLFQGTATSALTLAGYNPADFMLANANTSTSGTLAVLNNNGLTVGTNQDFFVNVAGNTVNFGNETNNGNLNIQVNIGGVLSNVISINGTDGLVTIPNFAGNASGNIAALNITNLGGNGVGNIGNSTSYFDTVFAKATSAQYADVAERFAADETYLPGTVVELGGSAEITRAVSELSETVFGVISTNAAYLMNSAAGTNETHPPIAMTGRVPVRVTGSVQKGDRLVSAGNGLARSAKPGEATAFNVIGRALKDKADAGEGMVEAIVTIK